MIEGIIEESEDETLMERYLGGEQIDNAVLVADLERAVARGSFFPVIPVCSTTGTGAAELLDVIARGFPSPQSMYRRRCSPRPVWRSPRPPAIPPHRCWQRW